MTWIRVTTVIDASAADVWDEIENVEDHVTWMDDAVAIRFTSGDHSGLGARFDCDTRIGPLRLTDQMEITQWEPGQALGVRHVGVVTGSGAFTLERRDDGGTDFTWAEELRLPWWMGGPAGALVARPILTRIWRRNLDLLKRRIEAGREPESTRT